MLSRKASSKWLGWDRGSPNKWETIGAPAEVVPQELGKLSRAFHVVSVRRFIIFRHFYLKVNHANICKPQRVSEEKNFFILGWKMG